VKVLITGGCGFVGRHLSESLRSTGHEVDVVDRTACGGASHECDLLDFGRLVGLLESLRPHRVVHLAAWSSVGLSLRDPVGAFEANAQCTVNLLEGVKALDLGCRVLVVSSGEVYGASEAGEPLGEDSPVAPMSPYALGKACAELASLYYGSVGGVDVVLARAFNHTGPGQTDVFALPSFAKQIAEAECGLAEPVLRVGNLDVVRDFTDVRDVVRAYRLILEKEPPAGVYNVCSGRGYVLRELVERLVGMSTVKVEVRREEMRRRAGEAERLVGDNARIARDLGWRPEIPIEKTLGDLLEYWREKTAERRESEGG